MNSEQLKTWVVLAENKSFQLTAKKLYLAQSTVSARILELEKEVGVPLIIRKHHQNELTEAGKQLTEYARHILALENEAIYQAQLASRQQNALVIASVYAYYDVYLSHALKEVLSEVTKQACLRLNFGHSFQVISECQRGTADLCFSHHPFVHPDYVCELVASDPLVLVTDFKNIAYQHGLELAEIKNLPMISANFLYQKTHDLLFECHHLFRLEVEIARHIIPFLKDAKWYTIIGKAMVQDELRRQELREIPLLDKQLPDVEYYLIYRKKNTKAALIQELLNRLGICHENRRFVI